MKYMGSKRLMLLNGLGDVILKEAEQSNRVVDLFTGSGAIAWFAAEHLSLPVVASDLQAYAATLAGAVVERVIELDEQGARDEWLASASASYSRSALKDLWRPLGERLSKQRVLEARRLCAQRGRPGTIWRAYGGHYFSPTQALLLDHLRRTVPPEYPLRTVCLASLIMAASKCVASPGHTAQPLRPSQNGLPHIYDAWDRDPLFLAAEYFAALAPRHAQVKGKAIVGEASAITRRVRSGDLVVIDPPYSDVQYSRFYHVLETVARGTARSVSGVGRYPTRLDRPQSDFSRRGAAERALGKLLKRLGATQVTCILTFPAGKASNGLSGSAVARLATEWFRVERQTVTGRFSTLGGNDSTKAARTATIASRELILVLRPHTR